MEKYRIVATFLVIILCPILLSAQDSKTDKATRQEQKKAAVQALIKSQNYDFIPQTALPTTGPSRQLTGDFDLKVTKAAIISYLPYYGRAYTAPMDPAQSSGQFTFKDFDYKIDSAKKGGWNIQIKPKDNREVQQLFLSIQESGYATLQVLYTNRQPMSFNGMVIAIRSKKNK